VSGSISPLRFYKAPHVIPFSIPDQQKVVAARYISFIMYKAGPSSAYAFKIDPKVELRLSTYSVLRFLCNTEK
jgi:hypothetical protein